VAACGPATQTADLPDKPVANITAPANGKRLDVGQPVLVQFGASDVTGVVQMEVTINGEPVYVETLDPAVNVFVADYTWTPKKTGSYMIQAIAFSIDGDSSDPVQKVVSVTEPGAAPPPTEPPAEQPSGQTSGTATPPLLPTYTPTSVGAPTSAGGAAGGTGDQLNLKARATALISLNVRSGPGTVHSVIGRLPQGEIVEIVGRDDRGFWWQIIFPAANSVGWIASGSEFSTAANTGSVPVVATTVAATPAPNQAPSPTPNNALKPTIFSFTADRYSISQGESVTLSWDLSNAKTAHLRYDDKEEGVVAPGKKSVSPTGDTNYVLVARNDAGETTAEITIKVGGPAPTAVPILRQGRTRISSGQSIDFDQGTVQDTIGSDVDFYWDGAKKQFTPQRGATGAMLSITYDDIDLERCRSISYGQPIDANPATLITGCYKTSEGNYGKFHVNEWDLAGNLTIEWVTWDYR
jgi:hypothetical protein